MVGIDPALVFLSGVRMKARVRQIRKHLKTVRGAFFYVFGFVAMMMGFLPLVISMYRGDDLHGVFDVLMEIDAGVPRVCISALLLAYCILTLFMPSHGAPIPFELAEIDFLFCGPFSRRQLLVHKLAVFSVRMLPVAAVFAVFALMGPWNVVAGVCGVFLAFLMALLFTTAVGLAGQALSARLYTRTRRIVAITCLVVLALGVWQGVSAVMETLPVDVLDGRIRTDDLTGLQDWVLEVAGYPLVRILLAPFEPFGRLLTAPRLFPDIFIWGSLALGIDALLLFVILKLDADYYETSLALSRKAHDNLRRLREGGFSALLMSKGIRGAATWTLPDLPLLGGAGVIAWRQLVSALRGMSRVLLYGLPLAEAVVIVLLVSSGFGEGILWGSLLVIGFVSIVYFPPIFRFDFRSDLDKMESLKALPTPPWMLAAGQLLAPTLIVSLIQVVLVGTAAIGVGNYAALPYVVLFAPLFNALLFSVENTLFLLFPTRLLVAGPGDFQIMARMYLTFLAKAAVLLGTFAIGLGPAGIAYWLSGSWALTAGVAAVVVSAEVVAGVACAAWAFTRFDVSTDTPA